MNITDGPKLKNGEDVEKTVEKYIGRLKDNACRACGYYRPGEQICFAKYVHKGRCPVYKILKKEFEKIGRNEE